jgi:hypothetical protein
MKLNLMLTALSMTVAMGIAGCKSASTAEAPVAKAAGAEKMTDAVAGGDLNKLLGGDPGELLKKAESFIGEGKLGDAKSILEKIKPYADKLPADLKSKAMALLPKVGL